MQIGIRVPRDLELIRKDLNMEKSPTLLDRIEDLDRRVASIEAKLNA